MPPELNPEQFDAQQCDCREADQSAQQDRNDLQKDLPGTEIQFPAGQRPQVQYKKKGGNYVENFTSLGNHTEYNESGTMIKKGNNTIRFVPKPGFEGEIWSQVGGKKIMIHPSGTAETKSDTTPKQTDKPEEKAAETEKTTPQESYSFKANLDKGYARVKIQQDGWGDIPPYTLTKTNSPQSGPRVTLELQGNNIIVTPKQEGVRVQIDGGTVNNVPMKKAAAAEEAKKEKSRVDRLRDATDF